MNFSCHYCKKKFPNEQKTKDHIIPKAMKGPNAYWNLVDSCGACNIKKSNKFPICRCVTCKRAIALWASDGKHISDRLLIQVVDSVMEHAGREDPQLAMRIVHAIRNAMEPRERFDAYLDTNSAFQLLKIAGAKRITVAEAARLAISSYSESLELAKSA